MKPLLAIIVGMLFAGQIAARCGSSGLWTYPENGSIRQNSLIVLVGYSSTQEIIKSLNQDYPVYLESTEHKVKLNIKSTHEGLYRLTQAILAPEEELVSGQIYYLKIDNLTENEETLLSRGYDTFGNPEPISWKVIEGSDNAKPSFQNTPKMVNKRTTRFGCGPEKYVDFKIKTRDESLILVKTELANLEGNESTIYYLTVEKSNELNVGHGMCSGAFNFHKDEQYKIRFSLMDICGNANEQWTDWIKFDGLFD